MRNSYITCLKSLLFVIIFLPLLPGCGGGGGSGSEDVSGEYVGTMTPTNVVECDGLRAPFEELLTITQEGNSISALFSKLASPMTGFFNPDGVSTVTGKDDSIVCSFVEGGLATYEAEISPQEDDSLSVKYNYEFKCDNSKTGCRFTAAGVFNRK